jgi:hypothetical protein
VFRAAFCSLAVVNKAPLDANLKVRGKEEILDEKLKELMQELGNAINESLSDSDRIAGAIGEIKQAGYDVFLVLEATIGFNKRDKDDGDSDADQVGKSEPPIRFESTGKIRLTSQDQKFLRALKIAVEEEGNNRSHSSSE